MTIIEALILGIVQGITEFLPISSDGHLELGKAMMNVQAADNLLFTVLVHGATVCSIIIVFWKDIVHLLRQLLRFEWNEDKQYIAKLALSMIPVGLVGLFLEKKLAALFSGNVLLVGILLIINGIILLASRITLRAPTQNISYADALLIGLAQSVAVLPGISRSTCTVSTALMLGIERTEAVRFSLLMVIVPILGATVLKAKDFLEAPASANEPIMPYIIGFFAAFLTGLLACNWLMTIVRKGKISYFAYYCFAVGLLAIIWHIGKTGV